MSFYIKFLLILIFASISVSAQNNVAALVAKTKNKVNTNMNRVYTGSPQNYQQGFNPLMNGMGQMGGAYSMLNSGMQNFGGNLSQGMSGLNQITQTLYGISNLLNSIQNIIFALSNMSNILSGNANNSFLNNPLSMSPYGPYMGYPQGGVPQAGPPLAGGVNSGAGGAFPPGMIQATGAFGNRLANNAYSMYASDDAPSNYCARGVCNFLEASGVLAPRGMDAWQTESWFESNPKWTKVPISDPSQAPLGSVLTYGRNSDYYNYEGGGKKYGHIEVVGQDSTGQRMYIAGGASTHPGGTVPGNFTGHAWVYNG